MADPKRKKLSRTINEWANKQFSYPGIDENALTQKKNAWFSTIQSMIAIAGLTILGWSLSLPTIVKYGLALLALSLPSAVFIPFMKKDIHKLIFSIQVAILLVTFYFMLKLGGLLNSAGLLFTGISILFMSVNLQNTRFTAWLFLVYMITLISTALLQPFLTPAPEMTLWKNLLFFTVNCSWQAGFTVILIINLISQRKKLAEVKQAEANRLKELDETKTRLFTNITHEFRTPLTIISGMANLIKDKPDEWLEEGVVKIRNNSQNLLHLVNQMLDLSKLESGSMPVHVFQQDIILQLRYLIESFSSMAASRNISLTFKSDRDSFLMDYDAEKLLHIVSNLLSNALKFTYHGGTVVLTAGCSSANLNDEFIFSVKDDGQGISADHLPFIFDRFYRIEKDNAQSESGTGLGLALTKELIKVMSGIIYVESTEGKGSTFTVRLPVTNNAPLREISGFSDVKEKTTLFMPTFRPTTFQEINVKREDNDHPILLIVEDSQDLVEYITAIFKEEYEIVIARNGEEGVRKAVEYIPDIILSDVMMPVMDGIAMLDKVKNDIRTSHIPVVMLTAKADIVSRLTGLERGADDYLSKPFNEEELHIRLKKLIELRRKLQQRYASFDKLPETEDKTIHFEDAFISKIRMLMEENLNNEEFGIHDLCVALAMSRAQLYRKFKSLTNKTIIDYLRSLRLHKAKELLTTTEMNVSEVCFEVGFINLSHFSRIFTDTFGINPSEIRK